MQWVYLVRAKLQTGPNSRAIRQDGANQVSIIRSTAEKQAAIEFAKAAAMRPRIVGQALQEISRDPDISRGMFDILEAQALIDGESEITLVPEGADTVKELAAFLPEPKDKPPLVTKPTSSAAT